MGGLVRDISLDARHYECGRRELAFHILVVSGYGMAWTWYDRMVLGRSLLRCSAEMYACCIRMCVSECPYYGRTKLPANERALVCSIGYKRTQQQRSAYTIVLRVSRSLVAFALLACAPTRAQVILQSFFVCVCSFFLRAAAPHAAYTRESFR